MSEEWIAGLITVTFIVGLIAWVPCLNGLNRCVSALTRASDRQADRYPWRNAHSRRSDGTEEPKVFRSS